ncbi:MAG: hypothetical protein HY351_02780, partial [Candidatus Omnitrophica bacterium]|nr:hypothetical protein [Candidatus Omnitrophota bacterium]
MLKKTSRTIGWFALFSFPILALSFLAYTVFHQIIVFLGLLSAGWLAFYLSRAAAEQERL